MASKLENLPTELILKILAYLPLQSLRALRLISKASEAFFIDNQSSIYHHAAFLHRFIDSTHTLLPEAKQLHTLNFLQDVPDWYDYCEQADPSATSHSSNDSRQEIFPAAAELDGERLCQGTLLWP